MIRRLCDPAILETKVSSTLDYLTKALYISESKPDTLSRPTDSKLMKRTVRRLEKMKREGHVWKEREYFLYVFGLMGHLEVNRGFQIWDEICTAKIQNFEHWECLVESIIIKDGTENALEFIKSTTTTSKQLDPSMKILLALCVGVMEENNLESFTNWFRLLRRNWWPLSRSVYTHLISCHMDALIRRRKWLDQETNLPLQNDEVIAAFIRSLNWILKHMHLTGLKLDDHQHLILIIGFCQSNLIQKALRHYHRFILRGKRPTARLLDALVDANSRIDPKILLKTHQFGLTTKPAQIMTLLVSHYEKFGLTRSLHASIMLVRFTVRYDLDLAKSYFKNDSRIENKEMNGSRFMILNTRPSKRVIDSMSIHFDKWKNWEKFISISSPLGIRRMEWGLMDR